MEVRGHGIVPTGFRIDSIGFGSILSVWLDSLVSARFYWFGSILTPRIFMSQNNRIACAKVKINNQLQYVTL